LPEEFRHVPEKPGQLPEKRGGVPELFRQPITRHFRAAKQSSWLNSI
jgi:hypothetical protein